MKEALHNPQQPAPERPRVDLRASIRALKEAVRAYNEGKELAERVPQQMESTAIRVLSLFRDAVEKGADPGAPFRVNGALVAYQLGYTPKTFDNHVNRLAAAGIMERKSASARKIRKAKENSSSIIFKPNFLVMQTDSS